MLERKPKYPLMTQRVSATVGARNWIKSHEDLVERRPLPPEIDPNGEVDYVKLEQGLRAYTFALREFFQILPEEHPSDERDTFDQKSFEPHLIIMKLYFDQLWEYPGFRNLLGGRPKEFLYMLVDLHDFARYIINGQYPLEYTERVSDGVERWAIAHIFGKDAAAGISSHFHTFRWITGEETPPDLRNATNAQKIALVLKTVDTISKGSNGELVNPDTIFDDRGPYDRWGEEQLRMGRFPLHSFNGRDKDGKIIRREVNLEDYKASDARLTGEGLRFIEKITGVSFGHIYDSVKAQTHNLHLFNH